MLESSEVASNESRSKSHRTLAERSQNSSWEKAAFESETPGAVGKRRVIQNSSREVWYSLMVTGSDWSQLFFPKGVLPNIKFRVAIILASPFFGVLCGMISDLAFFLQQKKLTCEYQNICNCNIFLGEVVHYLTEVPIFLTMTVHKGIPRLLIMFRLAVEVGSLHTP